MKKTISLTVILITSILFVNGQSMDTTKAARIALAIANKMQDSLQLQVSKTSALYNINLILHNKKTAARTTYASNQTLLRTEIQKIENTRDSLYSTVLSINEFQQYKSKKIKLISLN